MEQLSSVVISSLRPSAFSASNHDFNAETQIRRGPRETECIALMESREEFADNWAASDAEELSEEPEASTTTPHVALSSGFRPWPSCLALACSFT